MPKFITLAFIFTAFLSVPAYSDDDGDRQDKNKSDKYEERGGSSKGHGRPEDPGAHGRANAAEKQAQSSGKRNKDEEGDDDGDRDKEEKNMKKEKSKGKKKGK
jgi:hypothetical protein